MLIVIILLLYIYPRLGLLKLYVAVTGVWFLVMNNCSMNSFTKFSLPELNTYVRTYATYVDILVISKFFICVRVQYVPCLNAIM